MIHEGSNRTLPDFQVKMEMHTFLSTDLIFFFTTTYQDNIILEIVNKKH